MLAKFGGLDGWMAFEAEARAGIAEGSYDGRDVPVVLHCLRRWILDPF